MLDSAGRPGLEKFSKTVGYTLAGWGLTPDSITFAGVLLHFPVVVLLGLGKPLPAAFLIFVAGTMDFFDGAVAKARGGGSRRGEFFDSVADRVADALLMFGVAWYASRFSNELVLLTVACMGSTQLVSYLRAKAELSGFDAHVGFMERTERLSWITFTLAFSAFWDVLGLMLGIYLILTTVTAAQRFWVVWRQGQTEPPLPVEEARLLPDLRELYRTIDLREGSGPAMRELLETQRDQWRVRRESALVRRQAARAHSRAVRNRIVAERQVMRSSRVGPRTASARSRYDRRP